MENNDNQNAKEEEKGLIKGVERKEEPQDNQKGKEKNNDVKKEIKDLITKDIIPRGLNNIGATCYMNSVLQCFYHIFDLSNELLKLYVAKTLNEENLEKLPMTKALLIVISELAFGKKNSMSPHCFKEIIGNNESFRYYEANDSKTLALYVLDTLNTELNDNKITNSNKNLVNPIRNYKEKDAENIVQLFNESYNCLIGDLFNGLRITDYICTSCNNSVKNYQIFNIVSCSVEKSFINRYDKSKLKKYRELKIDILDCFKVEEKPNIFEGDNQIYCEKCNQSRDGKSINKIIFAPIILILFLDRGMNNKFMCDVTFPETLDINDYLEVKGKKYNLVGVIEHLGPSGQSGHFIANCRHFDGNWYMYSDSTIYETKDHYKQYGIPYLLFYRRED